jgi:hypothetical protein
MARSTKTIDVYLEVGSKRTIAGALEWPGWCRIARDEESALAALLEYAPRYAKVLKAAHIAFDAPKDASTFHVVERLKGNATTDFGAPDIIPAFDNEPVDDRELEHLHKLLNSYWRALDTAVKAAGGKELAKGPRGGGRELDGIVEHVLGADNGYLGRLAWKKTKPDSDDLAAQLEHTREMIIEALTAAAHGETPKKGPRGGVIWPPRFFVRRSGWHVLDHAWEIEDRVDYS